MMVISRKSLFVLVLLLVYLPLTYVGSGLVQYNSDEFVYYMMGREIVEGRLPYRDFFSAHMPVMLYSIAISYKVFGVSLFAAKLVPLIASFALLCLVYLTGERVKKNAGIVASILLFSTPLFQAYNSAMYGIMIAAAVIMGAVYAHTTERRQVSGLLSILALFTRLNTVPLVLGLVLLNRREKKFFVGMLYGFPLLLFFLVPNFVEYTIFFHITKTADPVGYKITNILTFIKDNWFILLLVGYEAINRSKNQKTLRGMMMLAGLFYGFILFQRTLFDFYLFFGLPIIALIAGSVAQDLFKTRWRRVMIVLFLVWIMLNLQVMINSYAVRSQVESVKEQIEQHTSPGDRVFCLSDGCDYLMFSSGRQMAGDLIDLSDARVRRYHAQMGEIFLNGLKEPNELVIIDLKEINVYSRKMDVDLSQVLAHLFENYFPVAYAHSHHNFGEEQNWWNDINHAVLFKPNDQIPVGEPIYSEDESKTRYYLEQYFFLDSQINPVQRNAAVMVENQTDERPYLPQVLLGRNNLNMTLVDPEMIEWPLTPGTHYTVRGNMTSDIWVSPQATENMRVFILAHNDGEVLSFSQLIYSVREHEFISLKVYSKLSEKKIVGYMPTYTQTKLTKEEYLQLTESSAT